MADFPTKGSLGTPTTVNTATGLQGPQKMPAFPEKGSYSIEGPSGFSSNPSVFGGAAVRLNPDDFKFHPKYNADNYELRALNQSGIEQLAHGLTRLVATTGTKFVGGLGFLGSIPSAIIEGDINKIVDNGWSALWADLEEDIKAGLPIYHSRKYNEGNILQQMGTLGFWMDDVVDGLAFMASAIIGSKGLNAAGKAVKGYTALGKEFSKLTATALKGKAPISALNIAKAAQKMDLATITLFNSVVEGSFEAKDLKDTMLAQGFTNEQASEAARQTFFWNIAALMPSNYLTNSLVLKGYRRSMTSRLKPGTTEVMPLTSKEKMAAFFKGMGTSMASEGPYEENAQLAIQNYFLGRAKTGDKGEGSFREIVDNMIKNFGTDEGQKAIVLGSLIGMLPGGIGGVKELQNEVENEKHVAAVIGATNAAVLQNPFFKDIWQRSADVLGEDGKTVIKPGEYIRDENGDPEIDKFKMADVFMKNMNANAAAVLMKIAEENGEQYLYDSLMNHLVSNIAFASLAHPDGKAIFEQELDKAIRQQIEAGLNQGEQVDEGFLNKTADVYKKRYETVYRKIYDNVTNNFAGLYEFSSDPKDTLAQQVKHEAIVQQYLSGVKQMYWKEVKSDLESKKADLVTSVFSDTVDTKDKLEILDNSIKEADEMIGILEKQMKKLVNEDNWKKHYSIRKKAAEEAAKKEAEQAAAAAAKATEEATKAAEEAATAATTTVEDAQPETVVQAIKERSKEVAATPEEKHEARKKSVLESLERPLDRELTGAEQTDEDITTQVTELEKERDSLISELDALSNSKKKGVGSLRTDLKDRIDNLNSRVNSLRTQTSEVGRRMTLEVFSEKYGDPRLSNMTPFAFFEAAGRENVMIVIYQNVPGELFIDPETNEVVFKDLESGKETIVTKVTNDEIFSGEYTMRDLGIIPIKHTVFDIEVLGEQGGIMVQGRRYNLTVEEPLSAIEHDGDGNPIAVSLFDSVGNVVRFTNPILVEEISYMLALMEEARYEAEQKYLNDLNSDFVVVTDNKFSKPVTYYVYKTEDGYKVVKPVVSESDKKGTGLVELQEVKDKIKQRVLGLYFKDLDNLIAENYRKAIENSGVREQEQLENFNREELIDEIKRVIEHSRPASAKEILDAPGVGEVQDTKTKTGKKESRDTKAGVEKKTEVKKDEKEIVQQKAEEIATEKGKAEERVEQSAEVTEESFQGTEALTETEQVTDNVETLDWLPARGIKHTISAVAYKAEENPEANVFFSDSNNTLNGYTLVAEIDWSNPFWDQRSKDPAEILKEISKTSKEHFRSYVDIIPIKLVLYNEKGEKVPLEGLMLHTSDFDNIVAPQRIYDLAAKNPLKARNEYNKIVKEEKGRTRSARIKIVTDLLKGNEVRFGNLNKSEGIISQTKGVNRPLTEVTDLKDIQIGIARDDGGIYYDDVLSADSTGTAVGAVFWNCYDTCNGLPKSVMLNPSKISEEEAQLIYEAYKLAANSKAGFNTVFDHPDITGVLTVKELINLLVLDGPITDQADKKTNRLPKPHLAQKKLVLSKGVLYYGVKGKIDLTKDNTPEQIKEFKEHLQKNKNHNVSQSGAIRLGGKIPTDFVIGNKKWKRPPIVGSKGMSYEQFLAHNQFVLTDTIKDTTTGKVFSMPLIIFDASEQVENYDNQRKSEDLLEEAKEEAAKKENKPEEEKKTTTVTRIGNSKDLIGLPSGSVIVQVFSDINENTNVVEYQHTVVLGSVLETGGKKIFMANDKALKELDDDFAELDRLELEEEGFLKKLYSSTFAVKGSIMALPPSAKEEAQPAEEETKEVVKKPVVPTVKPSEEVPEAMDDTDFAAQWGDGFARPAKEGEYEIGNVREMVSYMQRKFGKKVPLSIVKGLINIASQAGNEAAFGLVTSDMVTLSELAEVGTEYHEAYHRVSLMYLSVPQRIAIYSEAKAKYPELKDKSDREVEEFLAEKFRDYKLADDTKKEKMSLPKRILSFFKDLLGLINTLVTGKLFLTKPSIESLFRLMAKEGGVLDRVKFAKPNKKSVQVMEANPYYRKVKGVDFKYIPTREAVDNIVQTLVFGVQNLNNVSKVEDLNTLDLLAPRELMKKSADLAMTKALAAQTAGKTKDYEGYMYRYNMYTEVYDNYPVFLDLMKEELYSLGIEVFFPEDATATENLRGDELEKYALSTFELNHKETAPTNVKLAVKTLPSGEAVNPITLLPTFVDFDYMWNSLVYDLHDKASIEEMENVIGRKAKTSRPHAALLTKLQNSKNDPFDTFRTQFFTTMKKNRYYMYNVGFVSKGGKYSFSVGSAETMNLASGYASLWGMALSNSSFFKDGKPNSEAIDSLTNDFEELAKTVRLNYDPETKTMDEANGVKKRLVTLLRTAYVDIDSTMLDFVLTNMNKETIDEALKSLVLDKEYRMLAIFGKRGTFNSVSKTGKLFNSKGQEISFSDIYKNESSFRNMFGEAYVQVKTEQFTHSVIGPQGNPYYLLAENSFLTDSITDIKRNGTYLKEISSIVGNRHSRWIMQFTDPKVRERLKMVMMASFAQESTGDLGRAYSDINDIEDHLSKIALLNRRVPVIPLPTLGERQNLFAVEGIQPIELLFTYDPASNRIIWPNSVLDVFVGYIKDEAARIAQVKREVSAAEQSNDTSNLYKEYHYKETPFDRKGNGFKFMYFNDLNGKDINKINLREYVAGVLEKRLDELVEEFVRLGIITAKKSDKGYYTGIKNALLDSGLVKTKTAEFNENEGLAVKNIIASYMVNTMSSSIETDKVFAMDAAFYKSAEDKTKRLPMLTSPGTNLRLNFDPNTLPGERLVHRPSYNSAYLKTQLYKSVNVHDELVKQFTAALKQRGMNQEQAESTAKSKLRGFLKVDQTDGQAYITPQMHRALKIRLGEWTNTDQTAYDLLMSGEELTAEQQRVVDQLYMEPLKYVVFGTQPGQGQSAPVIYKMSIATITPQLAKGSEVLEEIYDRMQDENDPIDMLLFDTAVKVGIKESQPPLAEDNQGDRIENLYDRSSLNNLSTYKQNFKYLRRSQITEPKMELSALVGTQFKKIAMSNIYPDLEYDVQGKKMKGSEIIRLYKELPEYFSDEGKIELLEKFGWDKDGERQVDRDKESKFMASRARMARMPDAVTSALMPVEGQDRYEYDALPDRKWAMATAIGLLNRHTVDMRLPGATMIQMSNFGLKKAVEDHDLRLFDEDGFMEAKVSIEIFRNVIPGYFQKTLEERIEAAKNIVKGVGFRIPTQGANSAVALKIVDFLPPTSTTTISLPAEFTALTGSDFDIDKLYFLTYNYEVNDKGDIEVVKFLDETNSTLQQRLEAYVEDALKEEVAELKRAHFLAYKSMYEERSEFKKALQELFSEQENLETELEGAPLTNEMIKTVARIKSRIALNKNLKRTVSEMLQEAEDYLDINIDTLKKNWIKKHAEEFSSRPIVRQNTKRAAQNRLLDIYMTVLRSNHHILETKTPLDAFTGRIKKLASEVLAKEGYEEDRGSLSLTSPLFQAQVRKKYAGSDLGIGPFALHNVHHILGQIADLYYNGLLPVGKKKVIDGSEVTDLSSREGLDGEFIIDWFSALISAHVDAGKDPYIFALNVNQATFDTVSLLLRAGYGEDTFLFLSQPILKEYAEEYLLTRGRIRGTRRKAADSVKKKYRNLLHAAIKKEGIKQSDLEVGEIFNSSSLKADIGKIENKSASFYAKQLKILEEFLKLNEAGYMLNLAVQASQIDTKKYGNNLIEMKRFNTLLQKVMDDGIIGNMDVMFEKTFLGKLYENSILLAFKMFSGSTLTASEAYLNTVDDIMKLIGREYDVTNKAYYRLSRIADELFSSIAGRFFSSVAEVDSSYLKKILMGDESLAHDIIKLKNNPKHANNPLLKLLNPTIDASSNKVNYILLFNGVDKSSKYMKDKLIDGWMELHESRDPEVSRIARDLVLYSFYTSGFRTHMHSFFSYIDPQYLKDIGYNDFIRESREALSSQGAVAFMSDIKDEFFKSQWHDDDYVPYVTFDELKHKMYKTDLKGKRLPYPSMIQTSSVDVIGYNLLKEPLFRPYIKSMISGEPVLYRYVGYRVSPKTLQPVAIYVASNKLGQFNPKGRMIKENGLTESIFPENNVITFTNAELAEISAAGPVKKGEYNYEGFVYMPQETLWVEETVGNAETPTPVFDTLPDKSEVPTMTYAGIGSRQTPADVLSRMTKIAKWLESLGFTLNTGDAIGADTAFSEGSTKKNVFSAKEATPKTRAIAKEIHPNIEAVISKAGEYGLDLMARNTNQIFGENLDTPVDFIVVWTPDGATSTTERSPKTGGTGQAIDMASRKGIPVFNLAREGADKALFDYVKGLSNKKVEDQTEEYPFTDDDAGTVFSTQPAKVQAAVAEMGIVSFDTVTPEQMKQLRDLYAHCKIG